jgi:hypothetical protein
MSKLEFVRGQTLTMEYQYVKDKKPASLEGATVYFTVKKEPWDSDSSDSAALIQKTITEHTDPELGQTDIILSPTDTYIEPNDTSGEPYYFDIRVKDTTGVYPTNWGEVEVIGTSTNRSGF